MSTGEKENWTYHELNVKDRTDYSELERAGLGKTIVTNEGRTIFVFSGGKDGSQGYDPEAHALNTEAALRGGGTGT